MTADSDDPDTYNHIVSVITQSRIAELLERNNMTREELAKLTDASPQTLEAIEGGKYDPPLSLACKLAAAFHIPVERLYYD
jgi:putative transcriptional regulator